MNKYRAFDVIFIYSVNYIVYSRIFMRNFVSLHFEN